MEGYAVLEVTDNDVMVEEILNKSRIGLIPNVKEGCVERRIYTLKEYMRQAEAYKKDER